MFVALTALSCSDNPAIRFRYDIERQFFSVEKTARQMQIRPELADPSASNQLRNQYGQLLEYCYCTLDSVSVDTHLLEHREIEGLTFKCATRLSQLFFAEKNYDTCAAIIRRLLSDIRLGNVEQISAYYNLGRSLQAAGKWDSALAVYDYTVENFYPPVDNRGTIIQKLFGLPFHLYMTAIRTGKDSDKTQRFDFAEAYYQKLVREYPDRNLSSAANASLAELYDLAGKHEEAIVHLNYIRDSSGTVNSNARLRTADIYATKLDKLDSALIIYHEIRQGLTGRDTLLQPTILFKIGLVHIERKEYDSARSVLLDLKNRHSDYYKATPAVQLAIAQSFEREGNWGRAETEYRFLIDNYPSSSETMSTYLHLAEYFAKTGRTKESDTWYDRAEQHFDDILVKWRDTPREATALTFKAELYRQKGDLEASAEFLIRVFEEFPGTATGQRSLLTAARIYAEELDNRVKADSLVEVLRKSLIEVDDTSGI